MKEILEEIAFNVEYLETTEGETIECISIENLKSILERYNINKK